MEGGVEVPRGGPPRAAGGALVAADGLARTRPEVRRGADDDDDAAAALAMLLRVLVDTAAVAAIVAASARAALARVLLDPAWQFEH